VYREHTDRNENKKMRTESVVINIKTEKTMTEERVSHVVSQKKVSCKPNIKLGFFEVCSNLQKIGAKIF